MADAHCLQRFDDALGDECPVGQEGRMRPARLLRVQNESARRVAEERLAAEDLDLLHVARQLGEMSPGVPVALAARVEVEEAHDAAQIAGVARMQVHSQGMQSAQVIVTGKNRAQHAGAVGEEVGVKGGELLARVVVELNLVEPVLPRREQRASGWAFPRRGDAHGPPQGAVAGAVPDRDDIATVVDRALGQAAVPAARLHMSRLLRSSRPTQGLVHSGPSPSRSLRCNVMFSSTRASMCAATKVSP